MRIEKIDHVAILVKDIEKAERLFSDLFEVKFGAFGELKEMGARSLIEPSGVELVGAVQRDGLAAKTLESRGEGLLCLSLKVFNLDEAMAEMESHGIRRILKVERGKMRAAIYHPKDTFGAMIELVEYKTEHGLVTAVRK